MGRVVVIEFTTLDGIVQDPDGSERTPNGGWAFRFGPAAVTDDPFKLGELMESGALLLGRSTFELFSHIWPGRTDEFSSKMNAMRKYVVSRSLDRVEQQWNNSTLIEGDLVDEYRLLVFPTILGAGVRLFGPGRCAELEQVSVDRAGAVALLTYRRS